jgi:hypothetical protein
MKSFILPGNKTGVVRATFYPSFCTLDDAYLLHFLKIFVGTFDSNNNNDTFNHFQVDVRNAINQFKSSGVANLLIDITNNGGMYTYSINSERV